MAVRSRHMYGAATRETHHASGVDFTGISDHYYGSQIDLEPVTVVDIGQGSITDGAIVDGGLDGGVIIRDGTLPPSAADTTPPDPPSAVTVVSVISQDADGGDVVSLIVSFAPPLAGWPADYFGMYVYVTSESDNDPVTPAPVWTNPMVLLVGKDMDSAVISGIPGATNHWVYVRATDTFGNYSTPVNANPYPVMSVADTTAPGIPQSVSGAGGFKLVGLRWQPNSATDLMHNEIRIAPSVNADGTGGPDTTLWQTVRVRASAVVIPGLAPGWYYGQVRAVDYSGNVAGRWAFTGANAGDVFTCLYHTFVNGEQVTFEDYTGSTIVTTLQHAYVVNATATTFQISLTVGGAVLPLTSDSAGFVAQVPLKAVDYTADAEAGWSVMAGPMEATLVGAADVAFGSVITGILSANAIDAATIQTGILSVSTVAGPHADGIQILYGSPAVVVGAWDENGLTIRSKAPGRAGLDYLKLDNAELGVYLNGGVQSAINVDGINASAINFGVSPGGHNLVFNSSFELAKFIATSLLTAGTGGSTFAGGVGGWVLVTNTNATLAAAAITMAAL